MWGRPSVRRLVPRTVGSRTVTSRPRGGRAVNRRFRWMPWFALCLGLLRMPGVANAQDPVVTMNNELLNDTRLTSGLLVAGPPEVAREMAIMDSAMFDAANAASGLTYKTVAYS